MAEFDGNKINKLQSPISRQFNEVSAAAGIDTFRAHNFLVQGFGVQAVKAELFRADKFQFDVGNKTSLLGTPVLSNLEFPKGTYKTLDGEEVLFQGLRIDTVLFTVSQTKQIIKTPLIGRNGTVKEYIADGDFMITAEGILVGETQVGTAPDSEGQNIGDQILRKSSIGNKYPETELKRLINICRAPSSLQVNSEFLEHFEIDEVVIEQYDVPQDKGASNFQVFTLRMVSNESIEIRDRLTATPIN